MLQRFAIALGVCLAAAISGCGSAAPSGGAAPASTPAPTPTPTPTLKVPGRGDVDALIRVESPQPGALIASPLEVRGEARGTWYFEADFPVRLVADDGRVLVETYAQAQGEWMTEAFVPFASTLTFEAGPATAGTLVLERANPSDLPENGGELRIPVRFTPTR